MVLQLLAVYFLWQAVLINSPIAFGYTPPQFFTYILGVSVIRSVVFAGKSTGVQSDIGSGDLNNHLIRPINYFLYWFSQDVADKILNILFSLSEIALLIWLLKPPLMLPASWPHALIFLAALILAMLMYFYFSLIIGLTTFWMPEGNGWPQRFFVFVMLEFFSGGLFPLDILPPVLERIVSQLPTAYFLNHPLQIYLGRLDIITSFKTLGYMIIWTIIFRLIARFEFNRGVKIYGAYGR
jgi:ABC-2 type transport system permease protein